MTIVATLGAGSLTMARMAGGGALMVLMEVGKLIIEQMKNCTNHQKVNQKYDRLWFV